MSKKGHQTGTERLWESMRSQSNLIYTYKRNVYVRPGTARRSVGDDKGKKAAVDEIVARIKAKHEGENAAR